MISPESLLHHNGFGSGNGDIMSGIKMPGLNSGSSNGGPNPFSGIRRAGQAKRAQNFAKYSQDKNSPANLNSGSGPGGGGNFGAQKKTQFGSGLQNKFS